MKDINVCWPSLIGLSVQMKGCPKHFLLIDSCMITGCLLSYFSYRPKLSLNTHFNVKALLTLYLELFILKTMARRPSYFKAIGKNCLWWLLWNKLLILFIIEEPFSERLKAPSYNQSLNEVTYWWLEFSALILSNPLSSAASLAAIEHKITE